VHLVGFIIRTVGYFPKGQTFTHTSIVIAELVDEPTGL